MVLQWRHTTYFAANFCKICVALFGLLWYFQFSSAREAYKTKGAAMIYGYARVSTTGQSLETQVKQLTPHVDRIFQEKISGATKDRPELEKLLDAVNTGDFLVVCKLDRLARSTKDLLEIVGVLDKCRASLKVLNMSLDTSTPTGKLMLTMLGAIAEFERTLMLERQAEGIQRAKEQGKYKGRSPVPSEKAVQVHHLAEQGASWAVIAHELSISRTSVYRILKG